MTEQAKRGINRLPELHTSMLNVDAQKDWAAIDWAAMVDKVKAEHPHLDNLGSPARFIAYSDALAPLVEEFLSKREALQRIENGNAEYEEIMGLQK